MFKKLYLIVIALIFSCTYGIAQSAWYIQDSNPWGDTYNIVAMNNVFGAGNWQQGNFSATPAVVFDSSNTFVFLEGSDGNAAALSTFLSTNQVLIENWVAAGGHLFINAAPNAGGNISAGFDSTVIMYPYFVAGMHAVNANNAIFTGPYTPVATSYAGNYVAHSYISGNNMTDLLAEDNTNNPVLTVKYWNNGVVLFGGLTQPGFWVPQTEGINLWTNILSYLAAGAPVPTAGPCNAPANVTASNITVNGATFHWTGTAASYEYVIDTFAANPTAGGTPVWADSLVTTSLQHDQAYYFHVRSICDTNDMSAWTTISFTTAHLPDCQAPTGYATVSFTQVNPFAVLNWSAPSAAQYLWVLNNDPADPAVSGNATTNTTMNFANLMSNVTYYFHVRSVCMNGDTSSWTTISFVTASCPFPTATATVSENAAGPYATIDWSSPTAATYYWVLDDTSADPMVMGNATTATTMTFASLLPGTDYYFHIRCICTNGDTSTWTTIMFHTPGTAPNSVNTVNSNSTAIICSPNPTSDKITVTVTGVYDNATITLSGIDGKVYYNIPVTGNNTTIDMSKLPAALYFVKYTNKDYSSIIKVVKQ